METLTERVVFVTNLTLKTLKLSKTEKKIISAYLNKETDNDLGKELGLTKIQIRGKRQNIYAKLGHKLIFVSATMKGLEWPK